jgi:voltage-gated potassium channel Kch
LKLLLIIIAIAILSIVLFEGFETIILPRSVSRGFRLTRFFFIILWGIWRKLAMLIKDESSREGFIAYFGPLSLILILILWASLLVIGFACIQEAHGFNNMTHAHSMFDIVYFSGVTFTTLGFGDITPETRYGKGWAVIEAGTGFGFLAIVIGYLPVLYQAFSRREVAISLLDARAGSPPTASELLVRYGREGNFAMLTDLLREWEIWTSDVLESHLSYPVLAFYRSQHTHQSWIAALTSILDATALIMIGIKDGPAYQAKLTFAMARHAVVDLCIIFHSEPLYGLPDRLSPEMIEQLRHKLHDAGVPFSDEPDAEKKLRTLRSSYEPFIAALGERFMMPLPPWVILNPEPDNWMASGLDDGMLR